MIFRELSNAAFRFSLRRPGAEIMGAPHDLVQTPPPPSRRWEIQRRSRARVKGEISVCAAQPDPTRPDPNRPDPTRPDPITLLRSLYLLNGLTDSRAVFFVRCHHSINFVFDRYRYPPVPATARGTCRGEGVEDTLSLGNSTTAGPIAFKFGVWLGTH